MRGGGDPLEVDTPQALLESFLDAGFEQDWDRAAAAMDMANVDPAPGQADRRDLVRKLFLLVHRSIAIDWRALSDRPDAVDVTASSKDPMAGAARRSLVLGTLELEGRDITVRIARLQSPGGEPVWLFSRQTVENVPALFEKYGPNAFERALPSPLRKQAFWTLAWWEVIALPLVFLLALLAGALTYLAIRRLRGRLSDHERHPTFVEGVLRAVHLPASLFAAAGTFALIRGFVFTFSGTINNFLDPLQVTLVVVAFLFIVLAAIEAMVDFATDRRTEKLEAPDNEDDRNFFTKMSAVRRILVVVVALGALGLILIQSNITTTLGFSLVASAGVIGLVLVFAARAVLADLMASIQIAFAKTARIGDAVYYMDQWCYVERIGFTHLRLRTWDERRIMAPVGEFVGSSFENWTKEDPSCMMHAELRLDHHADLDRLREEYREFVQDDDGVIDRDDAEIQVIAHDAQGMLVRFLARAEDPKSGWRMACRLREAMVAAAARLDAATGYEPSPAYLPREREVRADLSQNDK